MKSSEKLKEQRWIEWRSKTEFIPLSEELCAENRNILLLNSTLSYNIEKIRGDPGVREIGVGLRRLCSWLPLVQFYPFSSPTPSFSQLY
ncbi:hypothetical protein RRG08_056015 [Elysia crispata]|uniref:Uncharacterized protein n=1 Tax=Elysia crispata TaxID=231223 RepID=A0AAE1AG29_9GAST|nr:hypothetical protein RRG08_056015 [Elysia crispata]